MGQPAPAIEDQIARAQLQLSEINEIYMARELAPEVLRVEIDQLKIDMGRLELLHKTDVNQMSSLVNEKHLRVGESINRLLDRVGRLETELAIVYGDPNRKNDSGRIGAHGDQLKRLQDDRDKAIDERWRMRLALVALGGTSGAAGMAIMRMLGL